MENKLAKVEIDYKQYGLTEMKAHEIEAFFSPMLAKMSELETEYNDIVSKEINPELCITAKALRLKYVKVRTGTADIHKELKAFYLAGGRFVDAWKNTQLASSQGVEDRLSVIEKHYENIDKERIRVLKEKREVELAKIGVDVSFYDLGGMTEEAFEHLLTGAKESYQLKCEAEQKAENERLQKEKAEAEERERTRIENEQLKKKLEEQDKIRKQEEAKRLAEEKKRKEKEAVERKKQDDQLRKEREEKEKVEKELREKREAEERTKREAEEKERTAKLAPDKQKLENLAVQIVSMPLPELKSEEAKAVLKSTVDLLNKTSSFIKEQCCNL